MSLYLAIDAGGTKTDFVLADEVNVLARVHAGTINRIRSDVSVIDRNLTAALEELSSRAGANLQAVTQTCIGTAGSNVPLVADWIRENVERRVSGDLILVNDIEIALNAAFPGNRGVLLLAGTGSNAAARSNSGAIVTAGGWGPVLGDQGSGYSIGLNALRNLFAAADDDCESSLLKGILRFWDLDSLDRLVEYVHTNPPPDFAQLTRLVVQSAARGDLVASETLKQAAHDLARLAICVIHKLQKSERHEQLDGIKVALAGSILREIETVRTQTVLALRQHHPDLQFLQGTPDPVIGALWQARQAQSGSSILQRANGND
ncbi:MAG TPA: BadF/BadG/BcrA/BcrD ATPase family protein [Terriglobia bacterium]|nr:BadF/BadG/BcrA/BcrD ATPase family protein [Terriglobia bacterium]